MSILLNAARDGDLNVVRKLLDRGANIEARDRREFTPPLLMASASGHVEVVALLLDRGAETEARQKDQFTALLMASTDGHVEIATLLLDRGARMEAKTESQFTPLLMACQEGHVEVATLLLNRGAEMEATDCTEATPLIVACHQGHVEVAILLVDRRADITPAIMNRTGIFHLAVKDKRTETLARLLATRARTLIDSPDSEGYTPLHMAIIYEADDIARLLIEAGASITSKDNIGNTPFDYANESQSFLKSITPHTVLCDATIASHQVRPSLSESSARDSASEETKGVDDTTNVQETSIQKPPLKATDAVEMTSPMQGPNAKKQSTIHEPVNMSERDEILHLKDQLEESRRMASRYEVLLADLRQKTTPETTTTQSSTSCQACGTDTGRAHTKCSLVWPDFSTLLRTSCRLWHRRFA